MIIKLTVNDLMPVKKFDDVINMADIKRSSDIFFLTIVRI